jgi:hypothetical protein
VLMSDIDLIPIPEGAECQEASTLSVSSYIPCCRPAVAIIYHERDKRGYLMCVGCAQHNVMNRGGKWVTGTKETEYLRK